MGTSARQRRWYVSTPNCPIFGVLGRPHVFGLAGRRVLLRAAALTLTLCRDGELAQAVGSSYKDPDYALKHPRGGAQFHTLGSGRGAGSPDGALSPAPSIHVGDECVAAAAGACTDRQTAQDVVRVTGSPLPREQTLTHKQFASAVPPVFVVHRFVDPGRKRVLYAKSMRAKWLDRPGFKPSGKPKEQLPVFQSELDATSPPDVVKTLLAKLNARGPKQKKVGGREPMPCDTMMMIGEGEVVLVVLVVLVALVVLVVPHHH
jgi:hypothetical protein